VVLICIADSDRFRYRVPNSHLAAAAWKNTVLAYARIGNVRETESALGRAVEDERRASEPI
jgi:hypothetical protein